jgi:hypothetical protein
MNFELPDELRTTCDVIPGRASARTRNPGCGVCDDVVWIPGSPLCGAPE